MAHHIDLVSAIRRKLVGQGGNILADAHRAKGFALGIGDFAGFAQYFKGNLSYLTVFLLCKNKNSFSH